VENSERHTGQIGRIAKEKLEESLEKNPNLKDLVESTNLEFCVKTKYSPLVSVDVERSFSIYKELLSSRRHSWFTFENLEKVMVIRYNTRIWDQGKRSTNDDELIDTDEDSELDD